MEIESLKEFTPIPFWFWNDYLSEGEILRQMKEMKYKGVDGFVIHPRKGLPKEIEYLSDEYFHYVKFAVQMAKEMDMKVVLYDEAMYPSGSAHGEVVKADPSFASKGLLKNGDSYELVPSGGTIRGVHPGEDDGEENAPKSADLLNPKAVAKFIEITHEKYYSELSEYFGDTIIAFFTDEPNILGRNSREDVIPWSEGILEEFKAAGGTDEDLKYLFENECDEISEDDTASKSIKAIRAKQIYKQVIHERLANSYYKQLSDWCVSHGIELTGHPEKSTDIGYLKYFQRPCQDIVWRFVEPEDGHAIEGEHSTMGKCSSDSARHRGKRRNGNECFGCCGERQDPKLFTEQDMRWYLNWLFVRGVNLVYPHAFYYSIREDRGDERPPEVGLNNPFWPQYRKMSDFIKRMCNINTDSYNCAQVAILCGADTLSWKIAKPLFTNQIEFNYLEAELLPECKIADGKLQIASQKYSVLISEQEEYESLNESDKNLLKEFAKSGGKLLIAGGKLLNSFASEAASANGEIYANNAINEDEAVTVRNDQELLQFVLNSVYRELFFSGDTDNLRCSHIVKDGKDLLILANEGMEPITVNIKSGEFRTVSLWNPYTLESRTDVENMTIEPCDLWIMELEANGISREKEIRGYK
ncbi:hypothetical protein [Butyrivibrio sp. AE2015]|uniref:hypothetical protein n=1 Tax=Butyrivibrio sp. AE2015 TaxID=1280663 RepID=UPI0003B57D1F|nr:hypothetical protein [Butyrivibrio sp. AE2015]